tara:strand:+ start:3291 stop:3821 length:531 start_codon:yes stop_codon:yes gene_type:complete
MYSARHASALAQEQADKRKALQEAQEARSRQKGAMSLWSTIGTVLGGAFGGPLGAAILGGLGSAGADYLDDAEKYKGPERGRFYKSEAQALRDQLSAADEAESLEHIMTGIKSGASAYAFGSGKGLGSFGKEGASMWDKLSTPFWQKGPLSLPTKPTIPIDFYEPEILGDEIIDKI